jgi:hypothetical protein
LFRIVYDPGRVTPERMLETVRQQGFRGEIAKDAAASPLRAGKVRRDLARLPEDLRRAVEEARKNGKPLLLAFHGPG